MPEPVTVDADDVRCVSAVFGMAARAFGTSMMAIPAFGAALEACGRLDAAAAQSQMPEDPVTTPQTMAIFHHQMLLDYENAGFERSEAFAVVYAWVSAGASASALRGINGG